jgi:phosphoribosylanthranilate isomerase
MVRVKICGLTNLGDALFAAEAGADALGFIAVPGTPRYVSPEAFREIRAGLPPYVSLVVVAKTIADAEPYEADVIQFYAGPASQIRRCVRVFRVRDRASLDELTNYSEPIVAVHLDTFHEKSLGGVGESFDWALAVEAKSKIELPLILAGGLTPENVEEAVRTVRPYAVDVSSGVEVAPGKKNREKVRAFIAAAGTAEKNG